MSKVAILTMIGALNHGAILQAIALNKVLKDNNIESSFVNYQSRRQKSQYSVINIYNPSKKVFIKNLQNIIHLKKVMKKIKKFKLFIESELLDKSDVLRTKKDVIQYIKNFDVIIVGSDQVWNLKLNDSSPVYFLDFSKNEKRIAYAVSLGGEIKDIYPYNDYIISKVQEFDAVSVRENIALDFFNKNSIKVKQVLDPTLLIDASWWESKAIRPSIADEKYMVYYSVNCKSYSVKVCKKLSNYLQMPVYNLFLHPGIANSGFIPFYDIDPFEFLGIIKYATLICTDSYHGLIFSLLFKKKFVVPIDENHCEDRKLTLVKMFNLNEHLFTEYTCPEKIETLKNIDDDIFNKINKLKMQSINFILESIGGV